MCVCVSQDGLKGLCDQFVKLLEASVEHPNHKEIVEPIGEFLYGRDISP